MSFITDNIGIAAFDVFQRPLWVFLIVFLELLVGLNIDELKPQAFTNSPVD